MIAHNGGQIINAMISRVVNTYKITVLSLYKAGRGSAVKTAIDNMKTSVVSEMLGSNKALQETVAKQSETITKQNDTKKHNVL